MMTFKTLRDQAFATKSEELNQIVGDAEVNANDTVYVEKTAPESEWNVVALATVADQLACGSYSKATVRWFEARGIRF